MRTRSARDYRWLVGAKGKFRRERFLRRPSVTTRLFARPGPLDSTGKNEHAEETQSAPENDYLDGCHGKQKLEQGREEGAGSRSSSTSHDHLVRTQFLTLVD